MATPKVVLLNGLNSLFDNGLTVPVVISSYTVSGNDYDDVLTYTQTGSYVTSGLFFPIKAKQGSSEAMLMEQGKILLSDKVLYTGSVALSGNIVFTIGSKQYGLINDGILEYNINSDIIYKKMFVRAYTGSRY